jgi:hypothetical protein
VFHTVAPREQQPITYDAGVAARLWSISEELTRPARVENLTYSRCGPGVFDGRMEMVNP